jgi:hypothetical protein
LPRCESVSFRFETFVIRNQKRPFGAFSPSRTAPHVLLLLLLRGFFASRAHHHHREMAPPWRGRSARVVRRDGATAGGDAVGSLDDAINARFDALARV